MLGKRGLACSLLVHRKVQSGSDCYVKWRGGGVYVCGYTFAGSEESLFHAGLLLFLISPVWCLFLSHSLKVCEKMSLPFWSSVSWLQAAWWWWLTQRILCVTWLWCSRVEHTTRTAGVRLSSTHLVLGGVLHCCLMLNCFTRMLIMESIAGVH